MADYTAYFNGEWVPYSQVKIDPMDRGFVAGDVVFDVAPEAWPILTDLDGNLTEGTGYNLLLVSNGTIRSPRDRSILQGVSRDVVFELAEQLQIPVVEEDLQPYDLYTADEAFFDSTSMYVLPVTSADKRQIGDDKLGTVTQQLLAA